jgi:hypothetical protein
MGTTVNRSSIASVTLAALALACTPPAQPTPTPAAPEAPAAAAFTPRLELMQDENSATLHNWIAPEQSGLTMTCVRDSATVSASADMAQFAANTQSGRGALVVSGASFEDEVMISSQQDEPSAIITVKMTPDLLKALAGAATARLMLGDSFAETSVDPGDTFEQFAAKCGELGKVKIAP